MARAADTATARAAARDVVARLRDAGHIAYFAGGCVRDELLGLDPTDYDVATEATPDRVAALFPRTMLVGAAFGVVLVQLPGATIEVATFRSDGPYSDARRPDRIHFSDPKADAQRRDFTINALFLDPLAEPDPACPQARGCVIDYVQGLADLEARLVRAVGDPEQRLAEDHLRALRAARFAARLNFKLDQATAEAITRHAADLRGVSRERIGEEVHRMLMHPSRAAAAHLLQSLTLDAPVLDGPPLDCPLPTLAYVGKDDADPPHYATVLAAWALDRADAMAGPEEIPPADAPPRSRRARSRAGGLVATWRGALKLSNEDRDEFAGVLAGYQRLRADWATAGVAPRKRMAAGSWYGQAILLLKVREPLLWEQVQADVRDLGGTPGGVAPQPFVSGDDLKAMGLTPGPLFKRVLDAVYDAQLEGRVRSVAEARELAKTLCV